MVRKEPLVVGTMLVAVGEELRSEPAWALDIMRRHIEVVGDQIFAATPPSTLMISPEMNRDSSQARNSTRFATSSG